jgi:hypothetical protein
MLRRTLILGDGIMLTYAVLHTYCSFIITVHIKWFPCHHVMMHFQAVDGGLTKCDSPDLRLS